MTLADEALAIYERALHPKALVMLKSGHFDGYVPGFDRGAARLAPDFIEHSAVIDAAMRPVGTSPAS